MNTKALRQKVLDLAIHGKLVPQNPNDESAEVLLKKIREEKAEKIKKGELKADKKDSFIFTKECEFDEDKLGKCSSGTRHKRHYEQFADGTVKDIEDEIPFEVPEGWAWCRLPEIAVSIFAGGDKPTICEKTKTNECTIPIFSNGIENNGLYGYTNKANVESPSVTISARGTIGFTCVREEPFMPIVRLITITPNYGINLYYLKVVIDSLLVVGEGSSIPQLTVPTIKEFILPLPPENEQKNIVEAITSIFENIDSLNKEKYDLQTTIKTTKSKILDLAIHGKLVPQDPNDEPAEELLKRISTSDNRPYEKMEEEFDYEIPKNWRFCKVKDVCSVIMGQSPEGEAVSDDKNGMEFHQGKICFGKKYLEESSSFTKHITKIAPKDSVLLCVRAPVGIVNITEREICIGRGLCAVIPKYTINSDFWFYWLQSLQSNFEQKATGTTFRAISVDVIKNQIVAIPPHEEQNRIVNKINELYEQLDKIVLNLV